MIVRWGLEELGPLVRELGMERALLVTSERLAELDVPVAARFTGVRRHAPVDTVAAAVEAARDADGIVAAGGGSAIDTGKAVSAQTGLRVIAVPTTYAGAEWTPYYGMRDEARGSKTGGGGASVVAAVYDAGLTLDLPREETVGTALNALSHAAEALYVPGRTDEADVEALTGAALIGRRLRQVVERPADLDARRGLLEGAVHAGKALGMTGLALAHAIAQALGGRYGLPHGAMNALSLPPTLRFNEPAVPDAIARLAEALGVDDAAAGVEQLAALGAFGTLRDLRVPEHELPAVAADVVARPGARANPRQASEEDVLALLREVYGA